MPNRIIKDSICTSDNLDNLSPESETLFYRLLVNCDDFGRMDARIKIIKSKCYPLKSDAIIESLPSWLEELKTNKLLTIYTVDGRDYLFMNTWDKHQQKRAKHSKYPNPNGKNPTPNLQADDSNSNQLQANVPEYEYESEYEKRIRKREKEENSDKTKKVKGVTVKR